MFGIENLGLTLAYLFMAIQNTLKWHAANDAKSADDSLAGPSAELQMFTVFAYAMVMFYSGMSLSKVMEWLKDPKTFFNNFLKAGTAEMAQGSIAEVGMAVFFYYISTQLA